MKQCFLILILLIFTFSPLFSDERLDKQNDYIAHCNLSFGLSFGIGGKIDGSHGLSVTLKDRYNDTYNFNYNPGDYDDSFLSYNIMLGLPFYYQKYFSFGMYAQALLYGVARDDDSTLYYGGGLYAEGCYREFSLRAGLGVFGINMSKNIGMVIPAWQGDPGYYTGSEFIKPGERLTASSNNYLGLSFNVSVKYYPFKKTGFLGGFFIQPCYTFFPSLEISDYELKLKGTTVSTQNPLPSFKIEPLHQISFLVGIGL
jgi:hypothetical protein